MRLFRTINRKFHVVQSEFSHLGIRNRRQVTKSFIYLLKIRVAMEMGNGNENGDNVDDAVGK